ncbi:MAG: hypothetical protein H0W29_07465 [Gemmatimonadales bacterium]|nr:hypothetical protein [Gemmatimonadales bacterium]
MGRRAEFPVWFSVAADSGYIIAVAALLPPAASAREAWMTDVPGWQSLLVVPFLQRVRGRLGIQVAADSTVQARLGRILAVRVALVRWGADAAEEFLVRNDDDILAALKALPEAPRLLGAPTPR